MKMTDPTHPFLANRIIFFHQSMMTIRSILFIIMLGAGTSFGDLVFSHTFKDRDEQPLSEILIHASPRNGNEAGKVEKRTDSAGKITMNLADGEWFIQVDEEELLERGFFCVPGSCFSAECRPTIINAVPLRPILTLEHSTTDAVSVVANFDWIGGIDPFLYRRYRIERSTDFINWEPMSSMLLSDPPIRLIDSKAAGRKAVYYRAVEEESYQVRDFTWSIAPNGGRR